MGSFVKEKKNLLLIDGNSLAYRWYSKADKMPEAYPQTIWSFAGSFSADKIIVCFDYGKSSYRTKLYPEYKANRLKPTDPDKIAERENFFNNLNLAIDNIGQTGLPVIKEYGLEADDIIYYLFNKYKDKYEKVYIISSDKDLYQLLNCNVVLFSPYHSEERDITWLQNNLKCTPEEYLRALILSGDNSDNIKGITGLGEPKKDTARSLKYAKLGNSIEEIIESVKHKAKKGIIDKRIAVNEHLLKLNEQLIDLSMAPIPKEYIESIEAKLGG